MWTGTSKGDPPGPVSLLVLAHTSSSRSTARRGRKLDEPVRDEIEKVVDEREIREMRPQLRERASKAHSVCRSCSRPRDGMSQASSRTAHIIIAARDEMSPRELTKCSGL